MTTQANQWMIVQTETGQCEILPVDQLNPHQQEQATTWGPYGSQGEAIAKRVGLIRAGQCKPA
jgi:hypothetical protein